MLLAWLALLAAHAQDSQRAAAAKQGGLQNVTVATSTRSSVRRKRTVVTSTKVCSAVEVVHANGECAAPEQRKHLRVRGVTVPQASPGVRECGRPRKGFRYLLVIKGASVSRRGIRWLPMRGQHATRYERCLA